MTASKDLRCVVEVAKSNGPAILKSCGKGGIFARGYHEKQDEGTEIVKEFRNAPLPLSQNLESCCRTAGSLGDKAWGVVPCGQGYAVRVRDADYADVVAVVQPEAKDKFIGEKWEVAGLPLSWNKENVKEFCL